MINFYLNLDVQFIIGEHIAPVPTFPGTEATWNYLRREGTIPSLITEATLNNLRQESTLDNLITKVTLNNLRREITFYKDYLMANQDPFEISKGGKLVGQKIFLNPLRVASDTLLSDETIVATQDTTGFTVDNIRRNSGTLVNEDGISFPQNTVIIFDVEAPSDPDEDLDEALLFFEFTSTAGLNLKVSHPIKIKEAIEVR